MRALRGLGDEDALKIYGEYVSGVDAARPEEYYSGFAESRLRGFLAGWRG